MVTTRTTTKQQKRVGRQLAAKMVSPESTTTTKKRVTRSAAAAEAAALEGTAMAMGKKASFKKTAVIKKKQPPIKKKTPKNNKNAPAAKKRKTTTTTKKTTDTTSAAASVRSTNATVTGGKNTKPSLETVRHELMLKWQHECSAENAQALLKSLLERPDIGPLGFIQALNPSTDSAGKRVRDDIISDLTLSHCLDEENDDIMHTPSSPQSRGGGGRRRNKLFVDKMDKKDRKHTLQACIENDDLDEQKVYEHFYKRSHREASTALGHWGGEYRSSSPNR